MIPLLFIYIPVKNPGVLVFYTLGKHTLGYVHWTVATFMLVFMVGPKSEEPLDYNTERSFGLIL